MPFSLFCFWLFGLIKLCLFNLQNCTAAQWPTQATIQSFNDRRPLCRSPPFPVVSHFTTEGKVEISYSLVFAWIMKITATTFLHFILVIFRQNLLFGHIFFWFTLEWVLRIIAVVYIGFHLQWPFLGSLGAPCSYHLRCLYMPFPFPGPSLFLESPLMSPHLQTHTHIHTYLNQSQHYNIWVR